MFFVCSKKAGDFLRDIEITNKDNNEENIGSDVLIQELEDFRRDIYERYGENIAEKRQNAYFSKKTGVLREQENGEVQKSGAAPVRDEAADKESRQETAKAVGSGNRKSMSGDRLSSLSLILGILAVIGLVLFFFL